MFHDCLLLKTLQLSLFIVVSIKSTYNRILRTVAGEAKEVSERLLVNAAPTAVAPFPPSVTPQTQRVGGWTVADISAAAPTLPA